MMDETRLVRFAPMALTVCAWTLRTTAITWSVWLADAGNGIAARDMAANRIARPGTRKAFSSPSHPAKHMPIIHTLPVDTNGFAWLLPTFKSSSSRNTHYGWIRQGFHG